VTGNGSHWSKKRIFNILNLISKFERNADLVFVEDGRVFLLLQMPEIFVDCSVLAHAPDPISLVMLRSVTELDLA
jgi:hypothetical protein